MHTAVVHMDREKGCCSVLRTAICDRNCYAHGEGERETTRTEMAIYINTYMHIFICIYIYI